MRSALFSSLFRLITERLLSVNPKARRTDQRTRRLSAAQRATTRELVYQGLNVCQMKLALFPQTGPSTPAAPNSLHLYLLLFMLPQPLNPPTAKTVKTGLYLEGYVLTNIWHNFHTQTCFSLLSLHSII